MFSYLGMLPRELLQLCVVQLIDALCCAVIVILLLCQEVVRSVGKRVHLEFLYSHNLKKRCIHGEYLVKAFE